VLPKLSDYIQLLILSAIWGSSFLAIEIAIENLPPFLVAFGRISFAALFLLVVIVYKQYSFPKDKKSWQILILAGILNNAVPFFLISWGQQYIDSSTAAIMLSCGPFIALLLSHYTTDDEKFSLFKLISVAFGFLGVFILVGSDIANQRVDAIYGQSAVLLATVCYISAGLLIRKLRNINVVVCSTSMFLTATFVMLPFVSFSEISQIDFGGVSALTIVYLAIFPTAIASLVRVKLVQRVGVQFMSQVAYIIPLFAIFWAWVFLSELPSTNAWIALCFILLGLLIRRIKE